MKPICIDANVFIASTKGNEPYSSDCRRVIQAVADGEFYLVEPTIAMNLRPINEHEKSNELVRTKTNSGSVSSFEFVGFVANFFHYILCALCDPGGFSDQIKGV